MATSAQAVSPSVLKWRKFVESKLFCWMLENITVWTITSLRMQLPEPETIKSTDENGKPTPWHEKFRTLMRNILISYASSVMAEVGAVYSLKIIDWLFFSHIPHFAKQKRSDSPFTWNAFQDWLRGNWWLQYVGGGLALGICESFWPEWLDKELRETKFNLMKFIRNFAIFRIVLDIAFYLGHRALHVNEKVYQMIHKRHHEFYSTNIRANWHFSAPDLFIESALPIGLGIAFLRLLGIKLGRFEIHLMQDYVAFHESGTHFNKPVKLISEHPILSILYDSIFPQIDARAIEFHETHHNRRDVNFGITPWLENLVLKTAEFQTDILKNAGVQPMITSAKTL